MKIVHGIAWYAPESWGGTEQYVCDLAHALRRRGAQSIVLAPHAAPNWADYEHQGTRVVRFPDESRDRSRLLADWFGTSGADVFHLHSWTPASGALDLRIARAAGLRTVFTPHIAAPVCARGTMMRYGKTACDGQIIPKRCASCWVESRGVPMAVAKVLAAIPAPISSLARSSVPMARFRHALGARADMHQRLSDLREAAANADSVVAVCEWMRTAMLSNGVHPGRVILSRQGVEASWARRLESARETSHEGFTVLCAGRLDPLKGQHVLVEAWKRIRAEHLRLRLVAPTPASPEAARFRELLMSSSSSDPRIEVASAPDRDSLLAEFSRADLVAIPSQTFETGPLVALEARALRVPVIASRIGGPDELIRPGVDGWLVPHDDPDAWAARLEAIASGRESIAAIDVARVRTMDDVAADMLAAYGSAGLAGVA